MVLTGGRPTSHVAAANSSPIPAASSPRNLRREIPAVAGRALEALRDVVPGDVVVSSLAVSSDGDLTTLNLRCAAGTPDAAERFAETLRRHSAFSDVQVAPQVGSNQFQVSIRSGAEDGAR
jgi:hypothetical protein